MFQSYLEQLYMQYVHSCRRNLVFILFGRKEARMNFSRTRCSQFYLLTLVQGSK